MTAAGLVMAWYNIDHEHQPLRVTPAIEAAIADRLWAAPDLVLAGRSEETDPEGGLVGQASSCLFVSENRLKDVAVRNPYGSDATL
jgi:hypothetical protein